MILVCLYPRVLNPLLNRLFKLAKRPAPRAAGHRPDAEQRARLVAPAWLANGLQIWILAEKFGAPVGRTILLALGGYAFAWCVGFVIVIAPAGAGIRDLLLVASLRPCSAPGRPWP